MMRGYKVGNFRIPSPLIFCLGLFLLTVACCLLFNLFYAGFYADTMHHSFNFAGWSSDSEHFIIYEASAGGEYYAKSLMVDSKTLENWQIDSYTELGFRSQGHQIGYRAFDYSYQRKKTVYIGDDYLGPSKEYIAIADHNGNQLSRIVDCLYYCDNPRWSSNQDRISFEEFGELGYPLQYVSIQLSTMTISRQWIPLDEVRWLHLQRVALEEKREKLEMEFPNHQIDVSPNGTLAAVEADGWEEVSIINVSTGKVLDKFNAEGLLYFGFIETHVAIGVCLVIGGFSWLYFALKPKIHPNKILAVLLFLIIGCCLLYGATALLGLDA